MKKINKGITLIIILMIIFVNSVAIVSAEAIREYDTTYWFSCKCHDYNCKWITLSSAGDIDTGDVYTVYWEEHYAHWPNGFTEGNTWDYTIGTTGYAKGTFTIYSSLITEWTSLAFQEFTDTITHVYAWDEINPRHLYYI